MFLKNAQRDPRILLVSDTATQQSVWYFGALSCRYPRRRNSGVLLNTGLYLPRVRGSTPDANFPLNAI